MIGTGKKAVWKLIRHYATDDDAGCLRRLMPPNIMPDQRTIDALLDELTQSEELRGALGSSECLSFDHSSAALDPRARLSRRLAFDGAGRGRAVLLYATARLLQPDVIIETGCFTGWDSAVLLQALDRNGRGHLYSIDVPARAGQFSQRGANSSLPDGLRPGFLVPPQFRERWTLIEGDVRRELMPLLDRMGRVGLFLHDSDHTYPHMMWEYTAILPHMAENGVIVSDDVAWNTAFWDFAAALGRRCVIHRSNPNVGAVAVPRKEQRR